MESNVSPWKPLIILLSLSFQVSRALGSFPPINATSVDVGFLWEHPRQENHHSTRVVVNVQHLKSVLRLICFISPSLPDEYEDKKNEIVKWEKVTTKHEVVDGIRFWDTERTTMAISFENVTSDVIGTYTCSYGKLSKSISVNVANKNIVELLKKPTTLEEVQNYVTHMEDTTGIPGWSQKQTLSQGEGKSLLCKNTAVSKEKTLSVHTVHPSDVQVVAAVGDGFMSGLGARATSWNGFFKDYRGISWSIGGEGHLNKTTTLPNILKVFNPKVKGFSTETKKFDLNFATVPSTSWELESQVNKLISAMQNNKEIDFQQDWKILTIGTGVMDLCHVCKNPEKFSASNYIKHVMHSLNILKEKVPRMYVNLVPPMDVSLLYELHTKKTSCQILGWNACPCAASQDASLRTITSKASKKYIALLEELVNSGVYDTTDQYTVVIQPFMTKGPSNENGGLASQFFGPDCLHFNAQGAAAAATALWNNMLEPLQNKATEWHPKQSLSCPSKSRPYLSTKVNSNVVTSDDDDEPSGGMPTGAAIALSVVLSAVVLLVTVFVLRSRKSRPNTDSIRLLSYPHKTTL